MFRCCSVGSRTDRSIRRTWYSGYIGNLSLLFSHLSCRSCSRPSGVWRNTCKLIIWIFNPRFYIESIQCLIYIFKILNKWNIINITAGLTVQFFSYEIFYFECNVALTRLLYKLSNLPWIWQDILIRKGSGQLNVHFLQKCDVTKILTQYTKYCCILYDVICTFYIVHEIPQCNHNFNKNELSLGHKLWFSNPYIFSTRCCRT